MEIEEGEGEGNIQSPDLGNEGVTFLVLHLTPARTGASPSAHLFFLKCGR